MIQFISKKRIHFILIIIFLYFPFNVQARYPNDPGIIHQWYINQVHAPGAWDISTGSKEVIVAVIDTGVSIDHPDLKNNIWVNEDEIPNDGIDNDNNGYIDDRNGWDFLTNSHDPNPKYDARNKGNILGVSHGTIVSGIIAAEGDNNLGTSGIVWNGKIMPLRVLHNDGIGIAAHIVKAIDYALVNGADIVNLSFFGLGRSSLIEDAVIRAYKGGMIVVAAGGNETNSYHRSVVNLNKKAGSPVCSASDLADKRIVIGVTSTDPLDNKSLFSNYGSDCIDISAPGYGFYTPIVHDEVIGSSSDYGGFFSGTSLSTPIIAGAAALIKSVNPSLENHEIIDILLESSDPIKESNSSYVNQLGQGRVNLEKALIKAISNKEYTFSTPTPVKISNQPQLYITASTTFSSKISVFDLTSKFGLKSKDIDTYPFRFKGGVHTEISMLNDDIFVIPGYGGGPQLMTLHNNGNLKRLKFIDNAKYRNGKFITIGNFFNQNVEHLVIGAGKNSDPNVNIIDVKGNEIFQFAAYPLIYKQGVVVKTGDLNDDGVDEIITATRPGGGPQVRFFNDKGKVLGQFFAYESHTRTGVNIAVGNTIGDTKDEIITAPGPKEEPYIKIFDGHGKLLNKFLVFDENFRGGVNVTTTDVNQDGFDEIIVAPASDMEPLVTVYNFEGEKLYSFKPYRNNSYYGGIYINASK